MNSMWKKKGVNAEKIILLKFKFRVRPRKVTWLSRDTAIGQSSAGMSRSRIQTSRPEFSLPGLPKSFALWHVLKTDRRLNP